ncbi:acyltransferase family protein [Roseateles toxinivorans]|uniref:Peptidoglycan/LPS O-acetylase OafA/YrhL n=1 Tax=Roseateles toxinivorans TaxID=270368 RepID=A0A4R6QTQ1_9BURK|nr:acyltransferase [Roseateles toxinivorans]TDP74616.1 peptidoglycan/LPS O-acetylase OafA/YrhL [Roseateles toxinivorans]
MTTSRHLGKLQSIEAARGLAAVLVVLVHVSSMLTQANKFPEMPFGGLFRFGHAGVDFFFVLSGFIIYYMHAKDIGDKSALGSYWFKRFVRIYPVYWIVLCTFGLILLFSPTAARHERELSSIISAIILTPNQHGQILGVAWSLSHELLFYGLFGLLFIHRWLGVVVLAAWAALTLVNVIFAYWTDYIFGGLVFRIFNLHFFVGMAVAGLCVRLPKHGVYFLLAGFVLFFGAGLLESFGPHKGVEWPPRHLAYALGSGMMILGAVRLEQQDRLQLPAWLLHLGTASYSIYLWHVIVIMIAQESLKWIMRRGDVPVSLAAIYCLVPAVLLPILFSFKVEQPLLERIRSWRKKGKEVSQ